MMKMTIKNCAAASVAALALGFSTPAFAQQSVSEVLAFLVTNQSVETGSIERDRNAAQATSDTISRALLANLATLPVTTSSGGFVYRLNPEIGTVERASPGFGPFFIERALTAGQGAASVGLTFQHIRFSSLDGRSLRDGSLVTTANQFTDEQEPFDIDQLTLNIDAEIATVHGNVGLGSRVEIGGSLPFVLLRLNGSRVNTYRGTAFTQATASATAVGLADAVVRGKVTIYQSGSSGFAAAVDARLPTGREEDLLGTGSLSMRVSGAGSVERGAVSTHANGGLSFGGIAREMSFGGAVAVAAASRVTLTGELLGRWMDGPGHISQVVAAHPGLIGVNTIRLSPDESGLWMVSAAPGFKWNVSETWVLVANVTVPLTTGGLTSAVTPFVGIDYAIQW
jgi:hypothetical protein